MHIIHSEKSPQVCYEVESYDAKHVSKYSTLLVATIEEAKDKISQIEYIFCDQLYPNFQNHSTSLQKLYLEARIAAESKCKERHNELELQIKQQCLEKERALDDCKAFKEEKSRLLIRVAELENKLLWKEKDVDHAMELHANLLGIVREKEQLIKEYEERTKLLVVKSEEFEANIDAFRKELQEKKEELYKGKELIKELQRQIESHEMTMANTEQMLSKSEEEKKQLLLKLENVEASLKNELRRKVAEADEGKQLHEKLKQQVNWYITELKKKNEQLSAHETEKQMLLSRITHLQNKSQGLHESLSNGKAGVANIGEPHSDLAKQIELKNSELAGEKQKRNDLLVKYKKLKSQQCFLLKKLGRTNEDSLLQMEPEEESDPMNNDETNITFSDIKKRHPASKGVACELDKVKQEINNSMESSDDEKIGRQSMILNPKSSSGSDSPNASRWTTSRNKGSLAGGKRPGSGWRETRPHQSPGGPDPHDDFLDTPFDNIRGDLHNTMKDTTRDAPVKSLKDTEDSDDETQDMKAEFGPKRQQLQPPRSGSKGFKYVEPVRKKAERENLKGIECKQCKKFYDAVLSDAGPKNGEVDKQNFRCEHHDGVSRHRYRYAPPLTPEGFWNIGLDSEI